MIGIQSNMRPLQAYVEVGLAWCVYDCSYDRSIPTAAAAGVVSLGTSFVREFCAFDTLGSDLCSNIATAHSCCWLRHCPLTTRIYRMVAGRARKQEWGLLSEHIQSVAISIRPYLPDSVSNETLAAAVRAGAYLHTAGQGYRWVCLQKKGARERCLSTMNIAEPQREGEFDSRPIVRHWRKYHASLVRFQSTILVCYQSPLHGPHACFLTHRHGDRALDGTQLSCIADFTGKQVGELAVRRAASYINPHVFLCSRFTRILGGRLPGESTLVQVNRKSCPLMLSVEDMCNSQTILRQLCRRRRIGHWTMKCLKIHSTYPLDHSCTQTQFN
jgi:hypothetical protein